MEKEELEQRIAELEAQELGFIQTLCDQSDEIGKLKAEIQRLRDVNAQLCGYDDWAEMEAALPW